MPRDTLPYLPPELVFLGCLDHEFQHANGHGRDWRIRRLERNVEMLRGAAPPRLTEISRQLGLTPDHLGRIFKQQVGLSFRDFAVKERLRRAAEQLLETGSPVKEIAGEAGYQHASDFSRTFKRLFGVTPQEFRRRKRAQLQQC